MPPPLDDFPLARRWDELPERARAQIQPLSLEQAAEVHRRAQHLGKPRGPIKRWEVIEFADVSPATPTEWLKERVADVGTHVLVSWDQRTAVRVPRSVFIEQWQDFCHPGSDDVFVLPTDERWLLVYRHWEQLEFGTAAV